MNKSGEQATPRKLLLMTDMSARCDRAFERAVTLAQGWGAHLHVMLVLEDQDLVPATVLQRDLVRARADLGRDVALALAGRNVDYAIEVVLGAPARQVLATATRIGADLIVAGPGRYDRIREVLFGSTVDKVLRESACPVLMVNARPYRPYESVAVAVEPSETSRQALDCALTLFPDARVTAIHACPVSSLTVSALVAPTADRQGIRARHEQALLTFVEETKQRRAAAGLPGTVSETLVVDGDAAGAVYEYVHAHRPDLVVVGTQGRTGFLQTAIGNTVERMTSLMDCDILSVRAKA